MSRLQIGRISALDTETIGGYAVILSTEYRTWVAHSFEECVNPIFIDINRKNIGSRIMLWNQGYDSQAILKYLPDDNVNEIIDTGGTTYNDRYKIKYVKGKFLRIRDLKLKKSMSGYDIAQFFNYMHLDDAGEKYVHDNKIKSEITRQITERSFTYTDDGLYWYFAEHQKEIMEYCKQDAVLTQKLGVYLSNLINEMYGFRLSSYTAKTAIGKTLLKKAVGTAYPKFREDSDAGGLATESYHGGIFDCMKRGTFGECTDIDISSAYPYHMLNFPNWRNGNFIKVFPHEIRDTDYYGWIYAEFDYPLIPCYSEELNQWEEMHSGTPTIVRSVNQRKYYPTGRRWQPVTLIEYRFLKEFGYLSDAGEGYVWREGKDKTAPDPFRWIQEVYNQKQRVKKEMGKDNFQYALCKIPMNSAYGITAQQKGYALYRNMFYASYITAATRNQIQRMLEEIGYDRYISIATDGILLEGHIELPEQYTKGGLGSWDVDYWDNALVLANGIYQLERPDKTKMALRGMLSFNGDLKKVIEKNRYKQSFVPNTKSRPLTMYQAMRWKKYTKDDMNRFMPIGRTLSCNAETSKRWKTLNDFDALLHANYTGVRYTVNEVCTFK